WTLSDVLMCTASILNLVAISVDRYFIILHAMVYTQKRNAKLMLLMILVVWCISAVISIPPLFGWGKPSSRLKIYQTCQVSTDLKYQIYATVFSFYLPATAMIIIYIAIFRAAAHIKKRELETSCRAQFHPGPSLTLTPDTKHQDPLVHNSSCGNKNSTDSSVMNDWSCKKNSSSTNNNNNSNNYLIKNSKNSTKNLKNILNIIVNPFDKRDTKNKKPSKKSKTKSTSESDQGSFESKLANSTGSSNEHIDKKTPQKDPSQLNTMVTTSINQNHSASHVTISAMAGSRRNSIGKKFSRRLTQAFSGFKRNSSQPTIHGKNQKATQTLGVIMGCFMLCWLPFFILALIKPIGLGNGYSIGDYVPQWLDAFLLWLGYFNSALNPMIYARFNREFRKPFVEILCFRCRGINNKLRDEERKKMFEFPSHGRSSISHANLASNVYSQPLVSSSNLQALSAQNSIPKTQSDTIKIGDEAEPPLLDISACKEHIEQDKKRFFYGTDKPPLEENCDQFFGSNHNCVRQTSVETSTKKELNHVNLSINLAQDHLVERNQVEDDELSESENNELEPLRDVPKRTAKLKAINNSSTRSSIITNDSSFYNDSTSSILQPLEDSSSMLSTSYLKSIDSTSLDSKKLSSLKNIGSKVKPRLKSKKTDSMDSSIPNSSLNSSYSNAATTPNVIVLASNEISALSDSFSAKTNSICENSTKSETSKQRKLLNSSHLSGSSSKINQKQAPLAYCTHNKQRRSSTSKSNHVNELKTVEDVHELSYLNDRIISDV
ncbi:octopamine receptor, partial [Brachionus plicatilis]